MAVSGGYAYMADGDAGLQIYQGYGPAGIETGPSTPLGARGLKLQVAGNRVEYQIPSAGRVQIAVYNIAGQQVRTSIDEEKKDGKL